MGDYTEALSAINMALEVGPYDSQAYYSKALILSVQGFHTHNLGVLNTALQNLNKALQFNSDDTKALYLKGLLTQILLTGGNR